MNAFKDNFSKQSDIYLKYRPHYPVELYAHLSRLTEGHSLAWDCGTGNGQAAIGLANFYAQVIATDPSEQQIKNAIQHPKVSYLVEKAENTSIASGSVDIVTIANALHWFNFDEFYNEARRVLKKGGLIAAWCYEVPKVSAGIDKITRHLHDVILDDCWLAENRLVEKEYTTIPFPFDPVQSPAFFSRREMNLEDMTGYLNTWSATQRFIREKGFNPVEQLLDDLRAEWLNPAQTKTVTWKLVLKTGRTS